MTGLQRNRSRVRLYLASALLAVSLASTAHSAQQAQPVVTKDPKSAPAGVYKGDPNHTSVVARVPHGGGMSISIFRFGDTESTLDWNPANPAAAKLNAKVMTVSIAHPVKGFPEELAGKPWLDSAAFPSATFVSRSVRQTGPLSADIAGDLTFHGATHPMTLKAEMVGAGKNREGKSAIGFTATGRMKPAEFGMPIGGADEVELVIDTEFVGG